MSRSQPTRPSEPEEVPEHKRYYIGSHKPDIQHVKEFYKAPSMFENSDNLPNDPEQAGWDKWKEDE